ncbi:MAG TPA: ADP-ribosylglycohydrolase family protein, partial [Verrucomicrobiae bacterium]
MQYSPHKLSEALRGVLIGTAVGDSLGLPAEGLSRKTIQKRWGGGWRQRLIFGRGMISDDTEHACFVAQSLLRNDF